MPTLSDQPESSDGITLSGLGSPELVSVIVATNRGGPYLEPALRSVLSQTWQDWELVVVDDGSPDPDEIKALISAIPRSVIIRHDRSKGVSIARNVGVDASRGRFLVFLDDDDIWRPERLALQMAALSGAPDAVACYSAGWYMDAAGEFAGDDWPPVAARGQLLSGESDIPRIITMMIRRAEFIALGGFNPAFRYAEDNELILRLLQHGEMVGISDALVGYRRHTDNVTTKAPQTHRDLASRRVVDLQIWAAEGRGDIGTAKLLRDNKRRLNQKNAGFAAREAMAAAHKRQIRGAALELLHALRLSPTATVTTVKRRLLAAAAPELR